MSESRQSIREQIQHLSPDVLFALARNESGLPEFRRAATEMLMNKRHALANAPELAALVSEIKREQERVSAAKARQPDSSSKHPSVVGRLSSAFRSGLSRCGLSG